MRRHAALLILTLTAIPVVAHADSGTPEEQRACRQDFLRYCREVKGDLDSANCLHEHRTKISKACRLVLKVHGFCSEPECG